jgi:Leucine-rich repeat (LRR) protein
MNRVCEHLCVCACVCDCDLFYLLLTRAAPTDLPKDVLAMTNLTELNLDFNEIRELPGTITVLKGLKSLSINENLMRTIPMEIEYMDRLERISMLNTPIEDLPLGLCHMTSLTELRSYTHELIPRPEVGKISTDEVIERTFNLLDTFEHMIKAFETRRLDLSDMELSFFPNEAFQISTLTELNIGMNKFEGVPGIIGNLNNLQLLNLAFNYLTQVGPP